MRFLAGETVLRRAFRRAAISAVETARVVRDDERGLLTWTGTGAAVLRRVTLDGEPTRKMPLALKTVTPSRLQEGTWNGPGVLMFTPPGTAHSVWWFFTGNGAFAGWYVNLEEPGVRWRDRESGGMDISDQALDVWINPDRSWTWKDEDEFAERTGHPDYWNEAGAQAIRAEGERVIGMAERGEFPFDGTWVDFAPDPAWPPSPLTPGWDRPRALPRPAPQPPEIIR